MAADRLTPADLDALLNELGGLSNILGEATPAETSGIYQGLGLHLVYQPDQQALEATADLGRASIWVGNHSARRVKTAMAGAQVPGSCLTVPIGDEPLKMRRSVHQRGGRQGGVLSASSFIPERRFQDASFASISLGPPVFFAL